MQINYVWIFVTETWKGFLTDGEMRRLCRIAGIITNALPAHLSWGRGMRERAMRYSTSTEGGARGAWKKLGETE